MNKPTRFILLWIAVTALAILFFAGRPGSPAQASSAGLAGTPMPTSTPFVQPGRVAPAPEQAQLKKVIGTYFELRYQARSAAKPKEFQLTGFGSLLSNSASAKVFLKEERSKLAVELKNAQLNQLRYVSYKYSLQFKMLTLNPSGQVATVSLSEGNEVVYEISKQLNPTKPIISRAANIQHIIVLRKEKGQWKIISDRYDDQLWKMLRRTKKSTSEIISATSTILRTLKAAPRPAANNLVTALDDSLPNDNSSHPYDRAGAVAYAHQYWDKDGGLSNPDYFTFANDCQNFVSQALYEGGNVTMLIPEPDNIQPGGGGWYYLNYEPAASINQVSASWALVDEFFKATTQTDTNPLPDTWKDAPLNAGPEATQLGGEIGPGNPPPAGLMPGDVVQFQWTEAGGGAGGDKWDHSALVVAVEGGIPYLAAHSFDHDLTPYSEFLTNAQKIRFLHIERSNGYPPVHTKILAGADDAGANAYLSCSVGSNSNEIYFGKCPDGSLINSQFRFDKLQIPQHAVIKYAFVTFTVDGPYGSPVTVNIGATPWNILADDHWILGEHRVTPNIATEIAGVVAPSSWNYGAPITLSFQSTAGSVNPAFGIQVPYRRVTAFERSGYSPAKLTAAYSFDNDIDLNRPVVYSVTRASASPTGAASVNFTVKFSEAVTSVDAGDFALTTSGVSGAAITTLTGSGDTYIVTVNTGSGNGSIRLDVKNSDTGIVDADANALNGGFTSGESYTIDITPPTVSMVNYDFPDPTSYNTIHIAVMFSEPVTGVDTNDFSLTSDISDAAIIAGPISCPTLKLCLVGVSTGSGDGHIMLNLVDDDTIVDLASNPLGGAGLGNGNHSSANFTISKKVSVTGNVGIAGATLTYLDGTTKTVTADGSGNFSFVVPVGWSGTVTPSLAGYVFTPTNKTYTNLTADQSGENYTSVPAATLTPTETLTSTPTATATITETLTPTSTATTTKTPTLPSTPTITLTPTETATPTFTPTATALPDGTNLALNKPTTSSGSCGGETADKAVNGNWIGGFGNKWCDAASPSKWWQVDLGAVYNLSQFVIYHVGAGGESDDLAIYNTKDFNIQVSLDNLNWVTVASVAGNTADITINNITPTSARYVKLNITAGEQSGTTARIYEVQVYDPTAPIFHAIFGNAGAAGATLSYNNGGPQTARASLSDARYSFVVPHNWSGVVTPSLAGYIFTPASKTYTNVTTNLTSQNYAAAQNTPTPTITRTPTPTKTATLTPTPTPTKKNGH